MPLTYNSIGTRYSFSKNHVRYSGTCRSCNRTATLTSYDTTLCFVVLFIPLIPLGKKHIIDQCSVCRRHHVMKFSDWEAAKAREQQVIAAYRAAPATPDLAREALVSTVSLRDLPTLVPLGEDIEKRFTDNADLLRFLAEAHLQFSDITSAERILRAALAVDTTKASSEALANLLLRTGRPDDAAPLLQHIITDGIPDRVHLLCFLGECYQSKGKHDLALAAFNDAETINPSITGNEALQKLKALSQKHMGTSKAIPIGTVGKKSRRRRPSAKTLAVIGILAAAAAVLYLGAATFIGFSHKVFLVNGLSSPYTARIAGKNVTLSPHSAQSFRVPEGDNAIEILSAPATAQPAPFSLHTPFFNRPFDSTVYVINPDQAAVIELRTVFYGRHSVGTPPQPQRQFFLGKSFHTFTDINFPFEEFPKSIEAGQNNRDDTISRTGLLLAPHDAGFPDYLFLANFLSDHRPEAANAILHYGLLSPDAPEALSIAAGAASPAQLADTLRPLITLNPLRLEVHRVYQTAMESAGHADEVQKQYQQFLAQDPANADLLYLAGRVTPDRDRALAYFKQAASAPKPSAFAHYALALDALNSGNFPAAADEASAAVQLTPSEPSFRWAARYTAIAAGHLDEAARLADHDIHLPQPEYTSAYADLAYVRALSAALPTNSASAATPRSHTLADQVVSAYSPILQDGEHALERFLTPKAAKAWKDETEADIHYAVGDIDPFLNLALQRKDPQALFTASIIGENPAAAQNALQQLPDHPVADDLLLYIVAKSQHMTAIAQSALTAATEKFAHGDRDERNAALLLSSTQPATLADVIPLHLNPGDKSIFLTALIVKAPASNTALLPLATTLNFDRRFPHATLQSGLTLH